MNTISLLQDEFDAERQTNMAAVVAALQMWDVQNVVNRLQIVIIRLFRPFQNSMKHLLLTVLASCTDLVIIFGSCTHRWIS